MFTRLIREFPWLYYAPDDTGGGGTGGGTTNTPADTPKGGANPGTNQPGNEPRSFTQDELNAALARERREQEANAAQRLREKFGLQGSDEEITAMLKKWRDADDAAKSETEKQAEQVKSLETDKATLTKKVAELEAQLKDQERRFAVILAAQDAEAPHAEDVFGWARDNLGEMFKAVLTDEGEIDQEALKKMIDEVKAKRPAFFTPESTQPSGTQPRNFRAPGAPSNSTGTPAPNKKQAEEARNSALRQGANTLRRG